MTLHGARRPRPPPRLSPPTRRTGRPRGQGRRCRSRGEDRGAIAALSHRTAAHRDSAFPSNLSIAMNPSIQVPTQLLLFSLSTNGFINTVVDFAVTVLRCDAPQTHNCLGKLVFGANVFKKPAGSALPALFLFWRRRQSGRENVWRRRPKRRQNELEKRR